jgi:hypothetical protein
MAGLVPTIHVLQIVLPMERNITCVTSVTRKHELTTNAVMTITWVRDAPVYAPEHSERRSILLRSKQGSTNMTNLRELTTDTLEMRELDVSELDLATGGMTFGDLLHRMAFAFDCVLSGNTLTVNGDQLQCHM